MKRSELFKIIEKQYSHERKRYEYLHTKASTMLTISGVLCTGVGLFAGKELLAGADTVCTFVTYIIGMGLLALSVLSIIMAIIVRGYREIVDIKTLIIEAEEEKYEIEDIYSIMLANIADCSEHNGKLMDSAFSWLNRCSICLSLAIFTMILGVTFQAIYKF